MSALNPYLERTGADLAPWQERGLARLAEQRDSEETHLRARLEDAAGSDTTPRAGEHREAALGVVMLLRRRFDAWDVIWRGNASTLDRPARPAELEQRRRRALTQTLGFSAASLLLILLVLLVTFLIVTFVEQVRLAGILVVAVTLALIPGRFASHRRTREAAQIAKEEQEYRQGIHERALAERSARYGSAELPSWHPDLDIAAIESAVDSLAEAVEAGQRDLDPLQPLLHTRAVGSFPDALPDEAKALLVEFAREDEQWIGHLAARRIS